MRALYLLSAKVRIIISIHEYNSNGKGAFNWIFIVVSCDSLSFLVWNSVNRTTKSTDGIGDPHYFLTNHYQFHHKTMLSKHANGDRIRKHRRYKNHLSILKVYVLPVSR